MVLNYGILISGGLHEGGSGLKAVKMHEGCALCMGFHFPHTPSTPVPVEDSGGCAMKWIAADYCCSTWLPVNNIKTTPSVNPDDST